MEIKDLQNKLVAILGYGQEGHAVTDYLLKHGVKPVLFDQRPWAEWPTEEQEAIKKLGVNFIFGPDCFLELQGFGVAFRSPGINLKQSTINNLRLTSQAKWFFEHCPSKIIGATGTKGKGTTSSLIYEMLKAAGKTVYLTGNIGKVQPLEILDELKPDDWVVYELSSFQLQDLTQSPHIAVVLMTTSEHLDYHITTEEYVKAKFAITEFQKPGDVAIINSDFENSLKIGARGNGAKLYFSRSHEVAQGPYVAGDAIMAKSPKGQVVEVLKIADLQLRGNHNLENVCAAIAAAHCAGCGFDSIKRAAIEFKGLEHRLEFVAEKQGIKFYDDSFSTTPETAIAAIKSFNEQLIVILGGSSKNSDFMGLGKTISEAKNIKVIILIGQEAPTIKKVLASRLRGNDGPVVLEGAMDMPEIFAQIKSVAQKGDVVLLSPACASFGMFKNYKDRGEEFKNFVRNF